MKEEIKVIVLLQAQKKYKSKSPKVARAKKKKNCFYQNAQCVTVKNQNLSNSKKVVDY